jgi:hypothetical protein
VVFRQRVLVNKIRQHGPFYFPQSLLFILPPCERGGGAQRMSLTRRFMGEHKPLRIEPDAVTALLWKVFFPLPSRLRMGAVNEIADRLADIHERHGRGEPEWLVRLRENLASAGRGDIRTDGELLRAYAEPENDGLAFNAIYFRYRDQVRAALEGEGLTGQDAEQRIGVVFLRALEGAAPTALGETLVRVAREVAHDPDCEKAENG